MTPEIVLWLMLAAVVAAGLVSVTGALRRTAGRRHDPHADGGAIYGDSTRHPGKSHHSHDHDGGDGGDGGGGGD